MNKERRKALGVLIDRVEDAKREFAEVEELRSKLEKIKDDMIGIRSELETLKDEEQDAFDNLSENLQQGERGQNMEQAVNEMETAIGSLETLEEKLDELGEAFNEVPSELDNATSSIDNARGGE